MSPSVVDAPELAEVEGRELADIVTVKFRRSSNCARARDISAGYFKTWTVDRGLDHGLDYGPKCVGMYDAGMHAFLAQIYAMCTYGLVCNR